MLAGYRSVCAVLLGALAGSTAMATWATAQITDPGTPVAGTPVGPGAGATGRDNSAPIGTDRQHAPGTRVGPGTSLPGAGRGPGSSPQAGPYFVILQHDPTAITDPGVPVGPVPGTPPSSLAASPFSRIILPGQPVGQRSAPAQPGTGQSLAVQPSSGPAILVPAPTAAGTTAHTGGNAVTGTVYALPAGTTGSGTHAEPFIVIPGSATPDSGLTDCDIPFDELPARSPFCRGRADATQNGRRCERYSPSQFPEVVAIDITIGGAQSLCTGTLIGSKWVLTAAHCFLGGTKTSDQVGASNVDYVLVPGGAQGVVVRAENALNLTALSQRKSARRAVVYRDYGGETATPPMTNDLAVIELASPYPDSVDTAVLATAQTFTPEATLAGYGFSNADNGTLGRFNVTWPVPMKLASGDLSFKPGDGSVHRSSACQGDSGGPVFAGRYRGCRATDAGGEVRPRIIQGTVSYGRITAPTTTTGDRNTDAAQACIEASEVVMQSLAPKDRHDWICATTNREARGC